MRFSIEPRVFVQGSEFLPFAKNNDKNFGKNISKNVSGKYGQNVLIMLKNLQEMQLKLLQC